MIDKPETVKFIANQVKEHQYEFDSFKFSIKVPLSTNLREFHACLVANEAGKNAGNKPYEGSDAQSKTNPENEVPQESIDVKLSPTLPNDLFISFRK